MQLAEGEWHFRAFIDGQQIHPKPRLFGEWSAVISTDLSEQPSEHKEDVRTGANEIK